MEDLFVIVNSDRSCFGALADCFRAGDPEVVNVDVDRTETLLEAIESHSRAVDGRFTTKPAALRGSAPRSEPTPVPPPKSDHPKTTAPPAGTRPSYPPMRPKWGEVTDLAKADKVCCSCFRSRMLAQGCVPLAHAGLVISENPEGYQPINAVYAEKNKTWGEAKKNTPPSPQAKGPTRHLLQQILFPYHPRQRHSPGHRPPQLMGCCRIRLTTTRSSDRILTLTIPKAPPTHQTPQRAEEYTN